MTLRERIAAWEAEKADLLAKMEALQTRLDQSPGQQQVNQLQTEMAEVRQQLTEATAKLATLQATPPNNQSPPKEDDTLPPAPVPNAKKDEQPPPAPRKRKQDWL